MQTKLICTLWKVESREFKLWEQVTYLKRSFLLNVHRWKIASFELTQVLMSFLFKQCISTRTTDAQWSLFSSKSQTFGLGQTIWADKFWGIWGIFGRFISTHFGTVSPLSMFSINQPLFLQKNSVFISKFQIFIWDWDLNLGRKELGI